MFTAAVAVVVYFAIPSRLFLNVASIVYTDRDVVMVRHTPLKPVTARWNTEVVPEADDAADCSASGTSRYQVERLDTVRFQAAPTLWPCLDAGRPYAIRDEWQVLLFGTFPLRPYSVTNIYNVSAE